MALLDLIRQQKNEARKNPERTIEVGILTLLIGEVETVEKRSGKAFTDAQVIDSVKKLIKSNRETLQHVCSRVGSRLTLENNILEAFLPKQLSEADIRAVISDNNLQGIPAVMKFLNENYAGQFDKGMASAIAKSI